MRLTISKYSIKSSFLARRGKKASAKDRSTPQELEESLRSGLYLLVLLINKPKIMHSQILLIFYRAKALLGISQELPKYSYVCLEAGKTKKICFFDEYNIERSIYLPYGGFSIPVIGRLQSCRKTRFELHCD